MDRAHQDEVIRHMEEQFRPSPSWLRWIGDCWWTALALSSPYGVHWVVAASSEQGLSGRQPLPIGHPLPEGS